MLRKIQIALQRTSNSERGIIEIQNADDLGARHNHKSPPTSILGMNIPIGCFFGGSGGDKNVSKFLLRTGTFRRKWRLFACKHFGCPKGGSKGHEWTENPQ